jgi:hypothetical protein
VGAQQTRILASHGLTPVPRLSASSTRSRQPPQDEHHHRRATAAIAGWPRTSTSTASVALHRDARRESRNEGSGMHPRVRDPGARDEEALAATEEAVTMLPTLATARPTPSASAATPHIVSALDDAVGR